MCKGNNKWLKSAVNLYTMFIIKHLGDFQSYYQIQLGA